MEGPKFYPGNSQAYQLFHCICSDGIMCHTVLVDATTIGIVKSSPLILKCSKFPLSKRLPPPPSCAPKISVPRYEIFMGHFTRKTSYFYLLLYFYKTTQQQQQQQVKASF